MYYNFLKGSKRKCIQSIKGISNDTYSAKKKKRPQYGNLIAMDSLWSVTEEDTRKTLDSYVDAIHLGSQSLAESHVTVLEWASKDHMALLPNNRQVRQGDRRDWRDGFNIVPGNVCLNIYKQAHIHVCLYMHRWIHTYMCVSFNMRGSIDGDLTTAEKKLSEKMKAFF